MLRMVISAAAAAFLCCSRYAAAGDTPKITLIARETIPLELPFGGYEDPIKCDSDGNLFVRVYQRSGVGYAPVLKIGRDGRRVATFSIKDAPEANKDEPEARFDRITSFAVGPRGQVYVLSRNLKEDVGIILFDSEGRYKSTTIMPLSARFVPQQIAVFQSGEILLTGLKMKDPGVSIPPERTGSQSPFEGAQPETLILDKGGASWIVVRTNEKPLRGSDAKGRTADLEAVQLTQLVPSEDGNIYVVRPGQPPVVYAVSPAGELLRKITLEPPGDGAWQLVTVQVHMGRIAAIFDLGGPPHPESVYRLSDAESGASLFDYVVAPEADGAFACFVPPAQFTVFGDDTKNPGHMALRMLAPR